MHIYTVAILLVTCFVARPAVPQRLSLAPFLENVRPHDVPEPQSLGSAHKASLAQHQKDYAAALKAAEVDPGIVTFPDTHWDAHLHIYCPLEDVDPEMRRPQTSRDESSKAGFETAVPMLNRLDLPAK